MVAFTTPSDAPKWKRRLLYAPLARILIFLLVTAAALFVLSLLFAWLGWSAKDAPVFERRLSIIVRQLVPALGAYFLLVILIEKRRPAELAWSKLLPHGLAGLAAGAAFISATIGVLWMAGSYQVTGTNPQADWPRALLMAGLGTAVAEEIVFRGVVFRISEEGLGTWPALALSALIFGGMHAFNKGATFWSCAAIAIEAGALLGLVYHLWRSLPLVIGIHMAWNFTQGMVFGVPVSGNPDPGWLVSQRPGPDWLTGGAFGAEASVVAVALGLAACAWMAARARRTGTVVPRPGARRPIIPSNPAQTTPC